MTAISSATRLLTSFAVVLGAYWLYALLVVPVIEPEANLRASTGRSGRTLSSPTTERYRDLLVSVFAEDAWERSSPKILETDQGLLLFREHKPLAGGEMEVFPFTVVLRARDEPRQKVSASQPKKRMIVLRAREGATLAFDKRLDLTSGDVGKLKRARLRGKVTIYGPETAPGANDELNIVTHNVHIDRQRVVTRHDVAFRIGPHYGSGRNLTIDLFPKKGATGQAAKQQFGNIKLLELVHVDRINLMLKSGGLMGQPKQTDDRRDSAQAVESSQQNDPTLRATNDFPTPVEITCRGPFQFDFVKSVASFQDHVNVVAIHQQGAADQLNCQLLEVYVNPQADQQAGKDTTDSPADHAAGGMDVRRLVAVGHPVTMRVPSRRAEAIGQRLDYDVLTRNIKLTAPKKVSLKHEGDEIEARSIDYTIAEDDRLGTLVADGPGWISHRGKGDKAGFTARWTRLLDMQPREGRHVVSILGKANLGLEGMGDLLADEIFMWLREVPKAKSDQDHRSPAAGTAGTQQASKPRREVLPEKLLARGNVMIDSPQLSARTKKLEAWFKQHSPDGSAARINNEPTAKSSRLALGANPLIKQPGSTSATQDDRSQKKRQKFDLTGDLVRANLLQIGRRTEISGVDVAGNVKLIEIDGFAPGQQPLRIHGDVLQLIPTKDRLAKVFVVGKPARVAARGLAMQSARVNLDQARNLMWIDQAGEMTLPAQQPKTLPNRPAVPPPPLKDSHVSWEGGMQFDGRTVHFEDGVVFRGEHLLANREVISLTGRSQVLDVSLMQPLSFTDAPKNRNKKTEIRQIAMDGGVYMENHGRDERGRHASIDRFSTRNLVIDYFTGEIRADGRGWMKSVRHGNDTLANRAAGPRAARDKPKAGKEGLVFVHVTYDDGISGDLLRREVNFHQNVEAIYGPVQNWDDELDPTRRGGLGPEGMTLNCDKLTVAEMGPKIQGRRSLELKAIGNTHIEGETFEATADRISFAESKSVVVLEGTNRVNAELWHQHRIGAQRDHAAARKILYYRDTNEVRVEDARFLDLTRGGMSFRPRVKQQR